MLLKLAPSAFRMTLLFRKLFFPCLLASLFFSVRAEETSKPLNFVNDIAPILTKADCNTGGCHAKAITGQRGFRLSLLGFEPEDDYEHIVKEGRGRRVFPQAPDQSLLLLKAANIVPHGGGKKLDPQSEGYQTLVRWIGEGMPYSSENDATLTAIEVEPKKLAMKVNTTQALKVVARYSDGSTRDLTAMSLFEANDRSMAEADATGLVKTLGLPGNVAVMVRYSGKVSTFSISIPLGAPVDALPPSKNFIDDLVFANLKEIGVPPSPVIDDATFLRRVTLDIAMPNYDRAVSALIEDIYARGLDKRVLVVVTGEFGRTPKISFERSTGAGDASAAAGVLQPGRDHWPRAFSNIWAGGGLQTGGIIGASDKRGEDVIERSCGPGDFLATIYHHLGIDSSKITIDDFNGRPTPIVDHGKPIPELIV